MGNKSEVIGLIHKCNCLCIMCPNSLSYRKLKDMTKLEFFEWVDRLTPDVNHITFTGGEPTLRRDLFELINYVNQKRPDIHMRLLTNARMFYYKSYLDDFLAQGLKNLEFGIPICGPNAKTHDKVTKAKGSFEQTMGGMKNLMANGFLVELRIVINKINLDELNNMSELIKKELNDVLRITFYYMQITGNALKNKDEVFISYKKIRDKIDIALNSLNGFTIGLCHFPLCTVNPKWWPIVWRSVVDRKLFFPEKCNLCLYKKYCLGVMKSYRANFGVGEFQPIKQKYNIVESNDLARPIKEVL